MAAVDDISRWQHVRSQLGSYNGLKRQQGDRLFVLCPYHGEKTPSGLFNMNGRGAPGFFKCWGCGKTATWDEVAPLLGLEPLKRGKPKEEYAPKLLLPEEDSHLGEDETYVKQKMRRVRKLPRDKKWRHISTNLLRKIGARMAEFYSPPKDGRDGYWTRRMLYLPCYVNGEVVGFIKARIKKEEGKVSYINAGGPWSKTLGLFPFDYAIKVMHKRKCKTILLVEGQRDALRLLAMGIPAVSILGTQSWSTQKARLLEVAGVEHLVCFFDGDCAGIKATRLVKEVSGDMFKMTCLALWKMKGSPWLKYKDEPEPSKAAKAAGEKLWDPGNCPQWILDRIKRKFFSKE